MTTTTMMMTTIEIVAAGTMIGGAEKANVGVKPGGAAVSGAAPA